MVQIPIKSIQPAPKALSFKFWEMTHPLWQLGFRPFYLLAAVFAAIAVPLWLTHFLGWQTAGQRIDLNWHMHEMIFGVVLAVIIGFLFTAAKNWTELWTPRKGHLAALVALWLAGRLAMLLAAPLLSAFIDVLFIPCAAWPLYQVLQKSGNRRNLFLIGLLGLLTLCNMLFHAAVFGWINLAPIRPIQTAILIIVVIESVIGTRVIPMFTRNGAPGLAPVVHVLRDQITLALLVAAALAWVFALPALLAATVAVLAASAVLYRLYAWQGHRTLHVPLLWILHLSYAWIPVGFYLLALAELNLISPSAAFHALTVGSMAGLILGMMTRTTLGHTGRKLLAGKKEIAIFTSIQLGAVFRVLASLLPGLAQQGLILAALCWTVAFIVFIAGYGPFLLNGRVDGKEG